MTEIVGDAALLIDPVAPERAAQTIVDYAPNLPSLRAAGFRNLTRFAMNQVVDRYLAFYEQVNGNLG
jgi:hypothetical protein